MFASLASDTSSFLPYNRDLADQRRKYGESILRKTDEHLVTQEAYEQDMQQKLDAARQRRLDEKERLENLEVQSLKRLYN
jgi:RNA polymerase-associated protein CTR9